MRKREVKVAKVEAIAPPVSAIEALRCNLLYAMYGEVSVGDMRLIVRAQVEKAIAGDGKAAQRIIDMVQAGGNQGRQGVTHMQQAIIVNGTAHATMSEFRCDLVRLIAAKGPQKFQAIVDQFAAGDVLPSRIDQALQHEWFEDESDGWHITHKARAEVLEMINPQSDDH